MYLLNTHGFDVERKWKCNFLPRNLTGFGRRLESAYGSFYRQVESLDRLLARAAR
jgi:hypothetical protein